MVRPRRRDCSVEGEKSDLGGTRSNVPGETGERATRPRPQSQAERACRRGSSSFPCKASRARDGDLESRHRDDASRRSPHVESLHPRLIRKRFLRLALLGIIVPPRRACRKLPRIRDIHPRESASHRLPLDSFFRDPPNAISVTRDFT